VCRDNLTRDHRDRIDPSAELWTVEVGEDDWRLVRDALKAANLKPDARAEAPRAAWYSIPIADGCRAVFATPVQGTWQQVMDRIASGPPRYAVANAGWKRTTRDDVLHAFNLRDWKDGRHPKPSAEFPMLKSRRAVAYARKKAREQGEEIPEHATVFGVWDPEQTVEDIEEAARSHQLDTAPVIPNDRVLSGRVIRGAWDPDKQQLTVGGALVVGAIGGWVFPPTQGPDWMKANGYTAAEFRRRRETREQKVAA
jgi:hypothetical protein